MDLTETEKLIVKLFRECETVDFYRHDCTGNEGRVFVGGLGEEVARRKVSNDIWYSSEKKDSGKTISVVGFLREGEEYENN